MITKSYETAYRLAFKCAYAELPAWKKRAYDEDKAAGKLDSAVMVEVAEAVEAHVNQWEGDPTGAMMEVESSQGQASTTEELRKWAN
jgi:hypothetical protein